MKNKEIVDKLDEFCGKVINNYLSLEDKLYYLNEKICAISKKVSSIELEMMIQRGACFDNNFEGKQDM